MNEFDYTPVGYERAVRFLKAIRYTDKQLSDMDGYETVATANYEYERSGITI